MTGTLVAKTAFQPNEGVLSPDKAQILLDGELVRQGEFHLVISTSLRRLFLGINPFWGREPRPVRFTCTSAGAKRWGAAALGILRGRPRPFLTPANGYTSKNVDRAEMQFDCGFTVDGEIFEPQPDEVLTLTADRRVTFVRA